ncbi:hypothetical protein [Citricoccus sp. NR2]|uniref:hypothetical protein n=1 Tax=Citricoccus sp. NR2 TaxID=3004095 RepID=UPI0022DCEEA5|nr:hypothetical protein [Citricoccus sp. NR2]WBL18068.1 hypothetical protein O1A05_09675 [Citricoccus sp. NR2]
MASVVSGMSAAAQSQRKRGFLIWGVVILLIWLACSLGFAAMISSVGSDVAAQSGTAPIGFASAFISGQFFGGIFFIVGAVFFLIGLTAEIRARSFNRRDIAEANELHHKLVAFAQTPRSQFYSTPGDTVIRNAKIIEIERHFDQQTVGAITGVLETSMRMFATSFGISSNHGRALDYDRFRSTGVNSSVTSGSMSGTTIANLSLSQSTRANLMGDALFAVFEINGNDTFRVVSMSGPGVRDWVAEMIMAVSNSYGGQSTHAGGVIAAWVPTLSARFAPEDVSYATDRLKALVARPYGEREAVTFAGTTIGRNAMIATHLSIGESGRLELLPADFPSAFGAALGDRGASSTLGSGTEKPSVESGR